MRSLCGTAIVIGLTVSVATADDMPWVKDWVAAKADAEKSGKLIMVDFYTDWCGWCKKLDKDTYTDAGVIKLAAQVVPLKTNAEKEGKDLAEKYEVRGFPTILFLTASGDVVGRIGGYMPPAGFTSEMKKAVDLHMRLPEIEKKLKENPDDGEANAWMVALHAASGRVKEAEVCLAKAEKAGLKGTVMAKAYNAVGDVHQTAGDFDKAVEFFKKADVDGNEADDRAYAKISIVFCHLSKGNADEAKKWARQVIDMKGAPKEFVEMAEGVLKDNP